MTQINYLDKTWSPVSGCSGKGCKAHCWVRPMVKYRPAIHGFGFACGKYPMPFSTVQFHPDRLDQPLHWRKPRRIGVCFTGDLFDEQVPDDWIWQICNIATKGNRRHTYFFLTKQAKRMADWFESHKEKFWHYHQGPYVSAPWPDPCLWWGVSICDQRDWEEKRKDFLKIPGKKWLSIEPMLGSMRVFSNILECGVVVHEDRLLNDDISWLVLGCESGKNRRPCPIEWMVDVVEQCQTAGVPVYVKQVSINGKVCHDINLFPEALKVRQLPCAT